MTTKLEQAARQLLEVAEGIQHGTDWNNGTHAKIYRPKFPEAITAVREALAEQAEQEPVAWALMHSLGIEFSSRFPIQETREAAEELARRHMGNVSVTPLYTSPPQREWVEPSDEQIEDIISKKVSDMRITYKDTIRAVLKLSQELNHGAA